MAFQRKDKSSREDLLNFFDRSNTKKKIPVSQPETQINKPHISSRTKQNPPKRPVPVPAMANKAPVPVKRKEKLKYKPLNKFDFPFFTIVIILLGFGIIMMFSASYAVAYRDYGDSFHYVSAQMMFAALGVAVMLFLSFIDYHILQNKKIVLALITVGVGLMLAVRFMGVEQGGAERWINLFGITFQPSEILKFVLIVFFAYLTQRNFDTLKDFRKGFLPFAVTLLIFCGLTVMQPHLSATIILFTIAITMMFVGGCRTKHMVLLLVATLVFLIIGVSLLNAMGYDYFSDRWLSFIDPEADIEGATFQTYQSLVTIGSGGLFGLGLGNSRQKYSYLPASQNDFVFSIICEELGFVGAVCVILLFLILVFRGFYIAVRASDKFGMMLVTGITVQIGLQALLNIAVVTNSIPNTGISLPFFSYGGTALVMQLAEIGIVLNVSRKAAIE